ncbi:hypothetical protein F0919_16550 [Taibaiella lutea]|uniref:DUF262 domain-containing protein n=1 Tax=Taibaiella lutea TaxID=2608001 RepID=A0A5M6CD67_9BACT|nr:hypothetical protein [Taibaiella lutea]KAA5532400.1 hypothetical protein F0919_16550 [Taibaiella lutea]
MEITSILEDQRIKSHNISVEFEFKEYLEIADNILNNNPFQRQRVKSSSSVYSLLRDDLKVGCIIPPIVLAITQKQFLIPQNANKKELAKSFEAFIKSNTSNILILDGLQRTYTIIDAEEELLRNVDKSAINHFHHNRLRCEFYLGIDKIGILYRMLTLNTGQTPMSVRHQIEILYSDYLNHATDGIRLIKEIDEKGPRKKGEYSFKEIINGFTSYLMRDYLTFDKTDILGNIKSLEKLSKENNDYDIFQKYTMCYHNLQIKFQELAGNWTFDDSEYGQLSGPAYGKNAISIFDKSQSMTGLGAAIGFLVDQELIDGFDDVISNISEIKFTTEISSSLIDLLFKLDDIRKYAPKIGNAQRAYFYYFFRELFNKAGDSYLVVNLAIENAFKRYRQNA